MPAQLSPSALEDFGRCPLSFLLRRLLRIPAMEDEAVDVTPQTIGMWAHRALELIVRRGFALTPDAMRQCLDEAIAEYPVSRLVPPFLVEYAADGLSSELYEALVREDWPPQGHTEVEVSLAWEWVWPMQGRVDRIDWMDDGGIRLVDYKTGTVLNPVVPSPANMQLLLYQQALAEHYGVPVEAELYGISQKSRFMRRRVSHAAGVAQREVIRSIAEGIRTRIREGKFWPVPDAKIQPCRLCAYRLVCPDQVVQEASVKNASDEEFLALWDAGKDSAHDAD
jgi:RecB family exonuclease